MKMISVSMIDLKSEGNDILTGLLMDTMENWRKDNEEQRRLQMGFKKTIYLGLEELFKEKVQTVSFSPSGFLTFKNFIKNDRLLFCFHSKKRPNQALSAKIDKFMQFCEKFWMENDNQTRIPTFKLLQLRWNALKFFKIKS